MKLKEKASIHSNLILNFDLELASQTFISELIAKEMKIFNKER